MRSRLRAPSLVIISLGVMALTIPMSAEDLSVAVTPQAGLHTFRTFAIGGARVESARPEFDNPLFIKNLTGTIRDALIARGLRESSGSADLIVEYVFTNEDGTATGSRPREPRRAARGTLIIDLKAAGPATPGPASVPAGSQLVWRGTYRDEQPTGSELGTGVLKGAKALVNRYPKVPKP